MNEEIKNKIDMKTEILKKIESGEVHMRSKSYFMFKLCVMALVLFLIFLVSTFLLSYILFSMKAGGSLFLLGYGTRGLFKFFMALPWLLLAVNTALILFLDWLLKSFKFGYKSPILYLFIGTFAVITLAGTLINFTSLHDRVMRRVEQRNTQLPFISDFYGGIRKTHREVGIFRGIVNSISTSTFKIAHTSYDSDNDDLTTVFFPSNFDINTIIVVGDHVFVAGDVVGNDIKAYGISKIIDSE